MTVINSNISAHIARDAIARNQGAMTQTIERLSTGKRINSSADDPAGLTVATRLEGLSRISQQGVRKANDGISLLTTLSTAGQTSVDIMLRQKELAAQAATSTLSAQDRVILDNEFNELGQEITRIYTNTRWNDEQVMLNGSMGGEAAGTAVRLRLDSSAAGTMDLTLKQWDFTGTDAATNVWAATGAADGNVGGFQFTPKAQTNALGEDESASFTRIDTTALAESALTLLDDAIAGATAEVARYGAYITRLGFAADALTSLATNIDMSRSRIEDADYAIETSNLSRQQIVSQAATAVLAQANQSQQTVMALLQ